MHDIRAIRDNPAGFDRDLSRRGLAPMSAKVLALDDRRRSKTHLAQTLQTTMNAQSREMGIVRPSADEMEARRQGLQQLRSEIREAERAAQDAENERDNLLLTLPNTPLPDVPDGAGEQENVELRRWGTPRAFDFAPKEHFEIADIIGKGMAFSAASRISGSRFVILSDGIARLHRALAQFMLDLHTCEHALRELWTPVLVKPEAMLGTGQLPKFGEDSYQTTNGWWLIPTAEVTLTNLAADGILLETELPWRLTAHTQCFRSEAGSAGKDTAGMLRQHQFEKVEMVTICTPDTSRAEHERMTQCAEAVLQRLGLPYRVIVLCTGDMGFGARRTHDLEVWLPGQGTYREISSVSTCGDFQARRMNARFRPAGGGKPGFVHTLNGSGLAVGRCLIAVLENGQQADGSVDLPEVLAPWLGGARRLTAAGLLA